MNDQLEQLRVNQLIIDSGKNHSQFLQEENARLERANSAWYNSKFLWLAIGAGATAYLLRK